MRGKLRAALEVMLGEKRGRRGLKYSSPALLVFHRIEACNRSKPASPTDSGGFMRRLSLPHIFVRREGRCHKRRIRLASTDSRI